MKDIKMEVVILDIPTSNSKDEFDSESEFFKQEASQNEEEHSNVVNRIQLKK